MADNKLAPKNNALNEGVRFDPSELYNLLRSNDALPAWVRAYPKQDGARGVYDRQEHTITAPAPGTWGSSEPTVAHEFTHATEALIRHTADELMRRGTLTPQQQRFIDLYVKTTGEMPGSVVQYDRDRVRAAQAGIAASAKALYGRPENDADYMAYRTQPTELLAHGTAGAARRTPSRTPEPAHLNSTFATQFSFLMDAFNQLPSEDRLNAARKVRQMVVNTPAAAYPDPFKP